MSAGLSERVKDHLRKIYPDTDLDYLAKQVLEHFRPPCNALEGKPFGSGSPHWSQEDMVLITYANSVVEPDQRPLETLCRFLKQYLESVFSIIHILPFFPFSSDDGFAVMDYYKVNPDVGEWKDIACIADRFRLMSDLVVNHTSSRSGWFENFKKGLDPGKNYYVTANPGDDLSKVVRPRTSPLLNEIQTPAGPRYVWCTFSHDQVDLDFKNPDVLLEFISIIRYYLDKGVQVFRLDAIAFLWKEINTTCLHLAQTHEIIKLFRTLLQARFPHALLITETNVPSKENISYLGNGDQAHVIYNFPLPPFLLNTLITGNSELLVTWLESLPETPPGATFLNFIASHDGIGLRPVEGYFSAKQLDRLIDCMKSFGGRISTRALNDHECNPYEINISLWDALKGTWKNGPDQFQLQRFICAHAVMLCLKGIPAFYIHSILGTKNDYHRRDNLQSNRAVNRHIWEYDLLRHELDSSHSHHHQVFYNLTRIVGIRKTQQAFHPDAEQRVYDMGSQLVAVKRTAGSGQGMEIQTLFCIHNISDRIANIWASVLPPFCRRLYGTDLITGKSISLDREIFLTPYQFMWIRLEKRACSTTR